MRVESNSVFLHSAIVTSPLWLCMSIFTACASSSYNPWNVHRATCVSVWFCTRLSVREPIRPKDLVTHTWAGNTSVIPRDSCPVQVPLIIIALRAAWPYAEGRVLAYWFSRAELNVLMCCKSPGLCAQVFRSTISGDRTLSEPGLGGVGLGLTMGSRVYTRAADDCTLSRRGLQVSEWLRGIQAFSLSILADKLKYPAICFETDHRTMFRHWALSFFGRVWKCWFIYLVWIVQSV